MKEKWTKVLATFILIASANILSAKNVIDIYMEGGSFMHIITLLLVLTIILAIIKYWQLAVKEKLDTRNFYLKLKGYIKNQQVDEAITICSQFKKTSMGFIFWSGLLGFKDAKKADKKGLDIHRTIQNSFDEAGLQTIPKIESGIFWFEIIAQVATLLGLLGTIFGLIAAFDALAHAPESLKQIRLTEGISQAMGTTAYGLIVAIPTMFVKGAFQSRSEKIINDIDEYSVKLINQIDYSIKG